MHADVVIVQEQDGYSVLHGCLHLANLLNLHGVAEAQICGGPKVKIIKSTKGIVVGSDDLPVSFCKCG